MTEAAIAEPLIAGLKRAVTPGQFPDPEFPANSFFNLWYDMIEHATAQLTKSQPLGASEDLASVIRDIHSLWHRELLDSTKKRGWGREFDHKSDMLFSKAGEILASRSGISDDMYKFVTAYGRLSMGLPYIAYHAVDAIIMGYGALNPVEQSGSEE